MSVSFPRIGTIAAVFAAVLAAGCQHAARPQGAKVIEVVVTTPCAGEVTDYQDFTGRLDALKTVDVRPRVSGYVQDAPFKEGDFVHEGELLFQIDPRTYQADLNQAEANLKQAEAERRLQVKNIDRGRKLLTSGGIGKEEYDQILANHEKSIATVGSMEAMRDRAKLYLGFTRVTAPLSGRISRRQVDPGNLVNADQTVLTTIVTEDPVYAYFDVDERTYLELATATSSGSSPWFSKLSFPVLMRLANEEEFAQVGRVNFLDNRLNGNTGTVRMRGVFDNPRGHLKSGLFVRIRLPLRIPYKTLLIPDEAVQSDQGKKFVYVVRPLAEKNEDGTPKGIVEYRRVSLGQSIQKLRAIKEAKRDTEGKILEGLEEGERVIVTGMQRVRADAVVKTKTEEPSEPPRSPLTELLIANKGSGAKGQGSGSGVNANP
ncbi:MAG TPA: efflux RND transporter periplasmic adaptor subunit [Gemmataceae bacterium]|jgi:RND family efflux transporter MFP subunit